MIELMLRDSVQHVIDIVFLPRNAIAQPRLRQGRNRLHQPIMRPLGACDSLAPRGFARRLRNQREIRSAFRLKFLTIQPPKCRGIPSLNVQKEFPDAMNLRQRFSRSRSSIHILQQLQHGRTMPGIALKCAAKLLGNQSRFRTWQSHTFTSPRKEFVSSQYSGWFRQVGSATTAIPAAFAASRIFSPSSSKHFPASSARQVAPAACIISIVFTPITGTSNRIS
jgi:hypothetical protein